MSRAATPTPMPTPTPMTTLLFPEELEGLVVAVELALDDSIIVLVGETRLVVETDPDVDEDEEDEGDKEEVGDADIVGDAELEVSEVTAAVEAMFEVCSEVVWDAKLEVVEVVAGVSRSQNCPDQKPPNARCSSVPVALTAWNVKGSELLP